MSDTDERQALTAVEHHMQALLGTARDSATSAARLHLQAGGSRVRARLALSAASALHLSAGTTLAIATACELLHNASLVHDDIQDAADCRRGQPSLWVTHGSDIAICAGDLLISAAYGALAGADPKRLASLLRHTHAQVSAVIAGQAADLAARAKPVTTLDAYESVAGAKSGPLLALPLELALLAADLDHALPVAGDAARLFAVAYQMADDLDDMALDLAAGEPNIVGVLRHCADHPCPREAARDLARIRYLAAADRARTLPGGAGVALARQAEKRAEALAAPVAA